MPHHPNLATTNIIANEVKAVNKQGSTEMTRQTNRRNARAAAKEALVQAKEAPARKDAVPSWLGSPSARTLMLIRDAVSGRLSRRRHPGSRSAA